MARRNLKGIFWLIVAITVVSLPLACSSSSNSPTEPPDAMTGG